MNRFILTTLSAIALAIVFTACGTNNNVYEEALKKDEYLKGNSPTKKQGKKANTPVKTTFDR